MAFVTPMASSAFASLASRQAVSLSRSTFLSANVAPVRRCRAAFGTTTITMKDIGDQIKDGLDSAKDKAKEAGQNIKEGAQDLGDKAKGAARDAKGNAQDSADYLGDKTKEARDQAKDAGRETSRQVKGTADDVQRKVD